MINELIKLGIKIKKQSGEYKTTCPKCSHTRKNKTDECLSVNITRGLYNCHNCGWSGTVNKFSSKPTYIKPVESDLQITQNILAWFKKRKISKPTLVHWKISDSIEYMPQVKKKVRVINFNYYRDSNLINIKYRDGGKHFKLVSGAELIFYGLDNIKELDIVYIVEGELDALSLHEAGFYSVCSVPNGASKGNQKLEYLDNCYQYFSNKKTIVLCTDNDEAGLSLRNELARRFGYYKCKYVDWKNYKDANDVLVNADKNILRNFIEEAKNFPLEGILNIDDIWNNVLSFNERGVKNYSIGLGDSDTFYNMAFGEWTVVTGIPNSGKSDVVDQICCNMAIKYGFRSVMFSPESFPYEGHIKRIANKLNEKNCTNQDLNETKIFIREHFHWIKIDLENLTLKGILDAFKQLVLQKGINICVIDPYNMLDHSAQKDYSYVGKLLSQITQFCQQTKTHLFLVAHPRKIESIEGKYRKVNLYDISGSSEFFNKAYNGLVIHRLIGQKSKYNSDIVRIYVEKVKRKENGKLGDFDIAPDFKNGGIYKHFEKNNKKLKIIRDNNIPF